MTLKVANLLLMLILCVLLAIQPSTSSPLENEKLEELTNRLDRLQTEVDSLKAEKVAATERFERLETKVVSLEAEKVELKEQFGTMLTKMEEKLTARIDDLEAENSQQYEEISHLRSQISNLESLLPPKSVLYYATNQSFNKNDGPTPRATTPPSSCEELTGYTNFVGMDGIQLVQNKVTKKIEAVFCQFSQRPVVQELVGAVDVKTKSVHFYVQRNSNFGTFNAVIPFELARINEGNYFNLSSGIFTVPVPGIYHFDFSAVKISTTAYLSIFLQVNGANVGIAHTEDHGTANWEVVSLSASLRLAAGDRVNVWNYGNGDLYEYMSYHTTHFSGWLVEEDLM